MVKVNFVHARAVVGKGLDGDRGILGLARQFLDASLACCHGLAVAQDRHLHSHLLTGPFCFVVTGRKYGAAHFSALPQVEAGLNLRFLRTPPGSGTVLWTQVVPSM